MCVLVHDNGFLGPEEDEYFVEIHKSLGLLNVPRNSINKKVDMRGGRRNENGLATIGFPTDGI